MIATRQAKTWCLGKHQAENTKTKSTTLTLLFQESAKELTTVVQTPRKRTKATWLTLITQATSQCSPSPRVRPNTGVATAQLPTKRSVPRKSALSSSSTLRTGNSTNTKLYQTTAEATCKGCNRTPQKKLKKAADIRNKKIKTQLTRAPRLTLKSVREIRLL